MISPYFSRNIDYIFFNKPICFINLSQRETILTKWYNYDQQKVYKPTQYTLPHTIIWAPHVNKTQHIQYMAIGLITEDMFDVVHIIHRPYIIQGNMLHFKKDLKKYTKPLRIQYNLK